MSVLSLQEDKVPFFHTLQESRSGWKGCGKLVMSTYSCFIIRGVKGLVLKLSLHSKHTAFS